MHRKKALAVAGLSGACLVLSGCIAAAVAIPPLAASAMIGNQVIKQRKRKRTPAEIKQVEAVLPSGAVLTDLTTLPPPSEAPSPDTDQGGIAQMISALTGKLTRRAADKSETPATRSVVLMPGATLQKPQFTLCETLPPALVVDLDTAVGAQVPPSDALADAFDMVREQGIKVIFVSSAAEKYGSMLETDLMVTGLGPAQRGDSLQLVGDRASSDKETLLWKIASSHCIIGMAGGEYSDFSAMLSTAPGPDSAEPVRNLPGTGWFILPQLQARTGQ